MQNKIPKPERGSYGEKIPEKELKRLRKQVSLLGVANVAAAGGLKSYQAVTNVMRRGSGRKDTIAAIREGVKLELARLGTAILDTVGGGEEELLTT